MKTCYLWYKIDDTYEVGIFKPCNSLENIKKIIIIIIITFEQNVIDCGLYYINNENKNFIKINNNEKEIQIKKPE